MVSHNNIFHLFILFPLIFLSWSPVVLVVAILPLTGAQYEHTEGEEDAEHHHNVNMASSQIITVSESLL